MKPVISYIIGKVGDRVREDVDIVTVARLALAVDDNLALAADGIQVVDPKTTRAVAFNAEDLALAVLWTPRVGTRRAVIVEETVETRPVEDQVLAVVHAETQGVAVPGQARAVVRIIQGGVGGVVRALCHVGVGLVVSTW